MDKHTNRDIRHCIPHRPESVADTTISSSKSRLGRCGRSVKKNDQITSSGLDKSDCNFRDPAFMANRDTPVHRWVPWIAGYSQQFVEDALTRYIEGYGRVLDPFTGVGTTLVEADRMGHEAIGFEINPYAAFASRIKLMTHRIKLDELYQAIDQLHSFLEQTKIENTVPISNAPDGFRTRSEFYSPKVLRKVLLAQDFIAFKSPSNVADIFRLAFAATMVDYSNYSYEPSLGRKATVGRADIEDYPVMETIADKALQMASDAKWYRNVRVKRRRKNGRVFQASFFEKYRNISKHSIDLVITSPPYLNNYHYNRNTRPHLYWLGFCEISQRYEAS